MSAFLQLTVDMLDNFTVERIERTYASEVIIVLTHHFKPFARNSSTTGNVLQKRNEPLPSLLPPPRTALSAASIACATSAAESVAVTAIFAATDR